MKIAFFEIEEWEKKHISSALKGAKIQFFKEPLSKKHLPKIKDIDVLAVFIYSPVTNEIIEDLPKLKLVTTMSTGFDHIDIATCKKRNIKVCNVPFYGENTVAEHTFALILALSRKIPDAIEKTRKGDFTLEGLRGFDLKDKTIGIIGGGHIGMHVARMAKGFEMNILVFDLHKDPKLAKKIGFKYSTFDNLLSKSDIVTLHVPYNPHTHHLINKKNIKLLKKGALLINTARGGLIETDALISALNKGTISAAGLDVLEGECSIREEKQLLSKHFPKECDLKTILQDHILLNKKNVLVTPHSAFNSIEALLRIIDTTIDNIKRFNKKKGLPNLVK